MMKGGIDHGTKNAWLDYTEQDEKELEQTARAYRLFLDAGKTERECVEELVRQAEAAGYVFSGAEKSFGEKIKTGDKIYAVGMKKIMALFHIGQEPLENGMNILGAHIDSPRLDVKAESSLRRYRSGVSGYPLLRRREEIPVGGAAPCDPRRGSEEGTELL